jgi:tellurite resistance protein
MEAARSILELMFLTAWSDGHFEGSEALAIHKLVAQVPLLRELRRTGGIDLAAKRRLAEHGLEACVREAAAAITDRAQRELAFQSCAKICGADGAFGPQEATVLRILREAWQFSDEDVQRLLVLATHP